MAASRVEVVHDIRSASLNAGQYDAIVYPGGVDPLSVRRPLVTRKSGECICAGADWVHDCLLTGSFLRLRETS